MQLTILRFIVDPLHFLELDRWSGIKDRGLNWVDTLQAKVTQIKGMMMMIQFDCNYNLTQLLQLIDGQARPEYRCVVALQLLRD